MNILSELQKGYILCLANLSQSTLSNELNWNFDDDECFDYFEIAFRDNRYYLQSVLGSNDTVTVCEINEEEVVQLSKFGGTFDSRWVSEYGVVSLKKQSFNEELF